jgi:hypothetical protein
VLSIYSLAALAVAGSKSLCAHPTGLAAESSVNAFAFFLFSPTCCVSLPPTKPEEHFQVASDISWHVQVSELGVLENEVAVPFLFVMRRPCSFWTFDSLRGLYLHGHSRFHPACLPVALSWVSRGADLLWYLAVGSD